MKVIESFKEATEPYYNNAGPWKLELVNDKGEIRKLSASEGEPEDNSFGRDLNFVFSIGDLIKFAYEAGKNGEEYEFIDKEGEDE